MLLVTHFLSQVHKDEAAHVHVHSHTHSHSFPP